MNRIFFEGADEQTKRFFAQLFNLCILNLHACRRGFFDTLICETDDPRVVVRWHEAAPQIARMIQEENRRGI